MSAIFELQYNYEFKTIFNKIFIYQFLLYGETGRTLFLIGNMYKINFANIYLMVIIIEIK